MFDWYVTLRVYHYRLYFALFIIVRDRFPLFSCTVDFHVCGISEHDDDYPHGGTWTNTAKEAERVV